MVGEIVGVGVAEATDEVGAEAALVYPGNPCEGGYPGYVADGEGSEPGLPSAWIKRLEGLRLTCSIAKLSALSFQSRSWSRVDDVIARPVRFIIVSIRIVDG